MNLPEDHMDELFRKAGEMYPLKTDGADWDKVMTRLQEVSGEGATPISGGRASNRRWWLLMLLIVPFVWICNRYVAHQGVTVSNAVQTAAKAAVSTPDKNVPGAVAPSGAPSTNTAIASIPAAGVSGRSAPSGSALTVSTPRVKIPLGSATLPSASLQTATRQTASQQDRSSGALAVRQPDALNGTASQQPDNNPPNTLSAVSSPQETNTFDLTYASASTDFKLSTRPRDTVIRTSEPDNRLDGNGIHGIPYRHKTHFYAGVLIGPDVSSVKWQEITKLGYSVGIILGLRFNKSLAVEASALWDRKAYYTSEQYFNKAKAGLPYSDSLGDMNGICEMFEIPINVRWDFFSMKHSGFYAMGGISSYMMKKESYSYEASFQGNYWPTQKAYKNSGNNFFSILDLSVGYTLQWKGVGDLRIEPYFKIPLSGVGIGSLPITSTGLYVGLTHSFR